MKWFLLNNSINRINLYTIGIKIYFYFYLIFYLSQKDFSIWKNVIYDIEKLVISQLIIFNKNVIIWKRCLVGITLSIRTNQVINGTYNIRSFNIKILIIIFWWLYI